MSLLPSAIPYYLKQQLCRASDSILLNVAEGASQQSYAMAKKHYRIAFASAAECAAAIDLMSIRNAKQSHDARILIERIGMMLKKLIAKNGKP